MNVNESTGVILNLGPAPMFKNDVVKKPCPGVGANALPNRMYWCESVPVKLTDCVNPKSVLVVNTLMNELARLAWMPWWVCRSSGY